MSHGKAHRKTTIWLDSDSDDGDDGYGFDIHTEDNMVMIETTLEDNNSAEDLEILIHRDLFPKIREVMDRIDARFKELSRAGGLRPGRERGSA